MKYDIGYLPEADKKKIWFFWGNAKFFIMQGSIGKTNPVKHPHFEYERLYSGVRMNGIGSILIGTRVIHVNCDNGLTYLKLLVPLATYQKETKNLMKENNNCIRLKLFYMFKIFNRRYLTKKYHSKLK